MKVSINIDRLVLDGIQIPHIQRSILHNAVEVELSRLLAENGLSPSFIAGVTLASLPGGAIQLSKKNGPAKLGVQIAQAVYEGIGRK